MKIRVEAIGKFDKVGEQTIADQVVTTPGEVPIRWTIPIKLWFVSTKITIVGRIKVTEVPG